VLFFCLQNLLIISKRFLYITYEYICSGSNKGKIDQDMERFYEDERGN
jgi:hypothetical protein